MRGMMSFGRWLKGQRKRADRVGDLARDAAADRDWPPRRSLAGFRRYLEEVNACSAAIETIEEAWALYEQEVLREVRGRLSAQSLFVTMVERMQR